MLAAMFINTAKAQLAVPGTEYVAVKVMWAANPPAENVGWYVIEFNDDGRSDNTFRTVPNKESTSYCDEDSDNPGTLCSITYTFQELMDTTAQNIKVDDELCFRVTANAQNRAPSQPSELTCFTMRGDGDVTLLLSAPTNLSTENIR